MHKEVCGNQFFLLTDEINRADEQVWVKKNCKLLFDSGVCLLLLEPDV